MGKKITLFIALLLLSGCQLSPSQSPTPTPGHFETGYINDLPDSLDHDGSFFYSGRIEIGTPVYAENDTFHDVTLCLYDEAGNVLNSTVIGDVDERFQYLSYSISADERPMYVTFDHPRFYEHETMPALTLEWTSQDGYRIHETSLANVQDDFEYPRHNETGRCL